ncbi:hypothetical protein Dda_9341 [Drechslerella dactyloides]|uniref:Uncharacterized protein n=1 Tax=Drechslerella dactyloides TaxID=74499 RepID=A0AAD6IT20_DREDA|nr:hypothetical protein Dda_9341 [Drechslerella dactyloides]
MRCLCLANLRTHDVQSDGITHPSQLQRIDAISEDPYLHSPGRLTTERRMAIPDCGSEIALSAFPLRMHTLDNQINRICLWASWLAWQASESFTAFGLPTGTGNVSTQPECSMFDVQFPCTWVDTARMAADA